MASKMAVSQLSKTYMTDILDKNTLKFAFLWMYRGLMIQTIKLEHGFDSEGLNLRWRPRWPSVRFLRPNSLTNSI